MSHSLLQYPRRSMWLKKNDSLFTPLQDATNPIVESVRVCRGRQTTTMQYKPFACGLKFHTLFRIHLCRYFGALAILGKPMAKGFRQSLGFSFGVLQERCSSFDCALSLPDISLVEHLWVSCKRGSKNSFVSILKLEASTVLLRIPWVHGILWISWILYLSGQIWNPLYSSALLDLPCNFLRPQAKAVFKWCGSE